MDHCMDLNDHISVLKMKRNVFITCCLEARLTGVLAFIAFASPAFSQAGIGVSGGNASSEEIHISYSVGQVFNNVLGDPDYYVSQGIQHPMLLVMDVTTVAAKKAAEMKIYPNPASEQLHIVRQVTGKERCRVLLMNMQGQVLIERTFETAEFTIPLETLGAGTYLLKIISGKSQPNTFNVIKAK